MYLLIYLINKDKINNELFERRRIQALEKERRLEDQAKLDRDEFQRIVVGQKEERDLESKLHQEKKQKTKEHAEELRKQIVLHEELKAQEKRDYLEEGKKLRDNLLQQKTFIEDIKETKLNDLKIYGIPEKYQYDLTKKKIIF